MQVLKGKKVFDDGGLTGADGAETIITFPLMVDTRIIICSSAVP
jgi:hypothetical protein